MLNQFSNILQGSKKVLLKVVGGVSMFLLLLFSLLNLDITQTKIAQELASYLSRKIDYRIEIGKVSIRWFDVLHLERVYVEDNRGREMIWVESCDLDYQLSSLFLGDISVIDHFEVLRPRFGMVQYEHSNLLNINEMIAKISKAFLSDNLSKNDKKPFLLKSAHVTQGAFFYDDQTSDSSLRDNEFDESHFYLDSIYSGLTDLYIHGDTVQLYAHHLSTIDSKTDILVKDLSTFFRYTSNSLEFYELDCHINDSYVADEVIFRYKEPVATAFADFSTKVDLSMNLNKASIFTKDLAWFAPGLWYLNDTWRGEGLLKGKVSNFRSKNFKLEFGSNSMLQGKLEFDGLPDFFETVLDFDLINSNIDPKDLYQYVTAEKYYRELLRLGNIKFSSTFYGFPLNFTAIGDFESKFGSLHNDITLKIGLGDEVSSYKGYIETQDFLLGEYIGNDLVGSIAIDGHIIGSGFSLESALINLDAKVDYIDFYSYHYENIKVDGLLKDRFFTGNISVNDSNLVMVSSGEINLNSDIEMVNFKAEIKDAYPNVLGFVKDSCSVSTILDVDFTGFDLETIEGEGEFQNSSIFYNGNFLDLKSFEFHSRLGDSTRFLSLNSNLLSATAEGDFNFYDCYTGILAMLNEFKLKIRNDENEISLYYQDKIEANLIPESDVVFSFDLKSPQPLLDLVFPEVKLSVGSQVDGVFSNRDTCFFHLDAKADSLKYGGVTYLKNNLDLIASKAITSNKVSASYFLGSQNQISEHQEVSRDFMLGGYWDQDVLTFNSRLKTADEKSGYNLNGEVEFEIDTTKLMFYQSEFLLDNGYLLIPDTNLVILSGNRVDFRRFVLLDNIEGNKHEITGLLDPHSDVDKAILSLNGFNLNYLSYFAGVELGGLYSGNIVIQDFYGNTSINSDFEVEDFNLLEAELGDYKGRVSWDGKTEKMDLNVGMYLDSLKLADINGTISTRKDNSKPLDLQFDLNNIPLKLIEPFMYGQVSAIQGSLTGLVRVNGDFTKPDFYGSPKILNGGFTVEYLKTHYVFNDKVVFKNDSILFSDINLVDTLFFSNGKLKGYVTHDLFTNFLIDATVSLDKTLVQNTKEGDNDLYFGRVFASGDVKLKGPYDKLVVSSKEVKSDKGTSIVIPLDSESEIANADFIKFLKKEDQMKDKFEVRRAFENVDITGITLLLNMNITEDALIDIVFDAQSGDKLSANGKGLLLVDMNPQGDFKMYGDYEIVKGSYSFSMLNLLNKSFTLSEGSKIYWNGDPYKGRMDLEAKYRVMTNMIPIMSDTAFVNAHNDIKRPSPVDVILGMKGNIMTPEIVFDIDIKEYPNYNQVEQDVLDFESRIEFNEQELNKQVFSLIILKRLSPLDDFNMNLSSTASASVSEVFTSQLGYMLSQLNEDLDVFIDLGSFESDNQSINVRLTYSVLDGRLRISHNGNYSSYEQNQDLQNLFGEWTVEYLLSHDGKLRMKGYNKLNQNTTSTALSEQNSTVYGVSVSYNDNFDTLSEFWFNFLGKFRREEDDELSEQRTKSKRLENLGL